MVRSRLRLFLIAALAASSLACTSPPEQQTVLETVELWRSSLVQRSYEDAWETFSSRQKELWAQVHGTLVGKPSSIHTRKLAESISSTLDDATHSPDSPLALFMEAAPWLWPCGSILESIESEIPSVSILGDEATVVYEASDFRVFLRKEGSFWRVDGAGMASVGELMVQQGTSGREFAVFAVFDAVDAPESSGPLPDVPGAGDFDRVKDAHSFFIHLSETGTVRHQGQVIESGEIEALLKKHTKFWILHASSRLNPETNTPYLVSSSVLYIAANPNTQWAHILRILSTGVRPEVGLRSVVFLTEHESFGQGKGIRVTLAAAHRETKWDPQPEHIIAISKSGATPAVLGGLRKALVPIARAGCAGGVILRLPPDIRTDSALLSLVVIARSGITAVVFNDSKVEALSDGELCTINGSSLHETGSLGDGEVLLELRFTVSD